MSVLNSYYLAGLFGAAIPILIHLFTRDRIQRVQFPTLRFFAKASRNVLRKKRLLEMILLAMRALACALLAIAFARPLLSSGSGDEIVSARTVRVIAADVSASMGRTGLRDALLEEAGNALDGLSGGSDVAALVAFSDRPETLLPPTRRIDAVRARIDALEPGHRGTDLAEAIRQAGAALGRISARTKEIVVLSDLQQTGWEHFKGGWKLPPDVKLDIRQISPEGATENRTIVDAHYPHSMVVDHLARSIAVRVANFSSHPCEDLGVILAREGEEPKTQHVNLRAEGTAPVRFRCAFATQGDNPVTVTLGSVDTVQEDNTLYLNVRVIPRINVLILNGKPSPRPLEDAAFFVEKALAPVEESPFLVRSVPANTVRAGDFEDVLVAVVSNVAAVGRPVVKALSSLLERGGGVLFLPGDRVSPDTFREFFGDLAPCGLRRSLNALTSRGEAAETVLAKIDYEHPIFQVFLRPHHGDLSSARFTRFWEVKDSQLSRVLARFDNGRTAILERKIGTGVSMMLVSPCDLRWNNLPLRAVFLPFLHQTVRYLAIRTERETAFLVGDRLPVPEGMKLKTPGGEVLDRSSFIATEPGFYHAVDEEGDAQFCFAVNRDAKEADPTTVSPDEIISALQLSPGETLEEGEVAVGETVATLDDSQNLWWYVILVVAVLLVAELSLANRAYRH